MEAGRRFGIPLSGTLAHSFIEAHDREEQAFRDFVLSSPEPTTLLIDTYDTLSGARKAVQVAKEMAARGQHLQGVRIDSGDLTAMARAGKIDPILGRDSEIRQLIDILTRRRQNNPILTGEAGVGRCGR